MRLRTGIAIFGLVPLLALMAGCGPDFPGDWGFNEDFHYSYPLTADGRIEVENFNGPVEITGGDELTVEISGTKYASTQERLKELKVDVSASSSAVVIRTLRDAGWMSGAGGVRYSIRVPRHARLARVVSSNGPIHVDRMDAGASLRTSNGPVRVNQLRGTLEIETSNGPVNVSGLDGSATIRTSNGPVELTLDTAGEIRATTSNGPITVHVPEGTRADVRARTSNGPIRTDFDLTNGYNTKNRLEGSIGGGGPLLDLATSNGPIRIAKL